MKMKRLLFGFFAAVALASAMLFIGCDPEKVGGGGLMQPYNAENGQYK